MNTNYHAFSWVFLLSAILLTAFSCSPHRYVDDDSSCSKAKPLPPVVLIKDELDAKRGDVADCKQVKYFKDAVANVEYRIGTAFEKHDIKGLLTLYDVDGITIDQRAVDPSMHKYTFSFPVKGQRPYFLELKATEGANGYSAQVAFKKLDPCASCGPQEQCVSGACVPKGACNPPCDVDSETCEAGKCVSLCKPRCRGGKVCNADTRRCERVKCSPRCKRGTYCYRGTCRKKRASKPVEVKCPKCSSNERCSESTGYKCVPTGPAVGPIVGKVTNTVRAGPSNTVVYINRGKRHGVKRGQKGKLCGRHNFKVNSVYPTRSRALSTSSIEEIGDCKSAVIKR